MVDDAGETRVVTTAASDSFGPWLAATGGSLVVSCYQAAKLALLGWNGDQATIHLRDFPRPMGLVVDGPRIAVGTLEEIVVLGSAPGLARDVIENEPGRYDALYMPRVAYRTGEVAVHGLAFGRSGLWFVNTRFSCLATPSDDYHFVPHWKPPFVSQLSPEDRCHLNGLAMVDGEPRFVTCLGASDTPGGWRAGKVSGGVVVSVPDGQIVASGLAMPHTPRWYDGRLWVLNSGEGQLGYLAAGGKFEVVTTLPGYLRGLYFLGPYAVVGMSRIRERHIFGGMPLAKKFEDLACGLAVIDLRNASLVATFLFTAGCEEVFDVDFVPGVRQGMILNNEHPAVHVGFTSPQESWWCRDDRPKSIPTGG